MKRKLSTCPYCGGTLINYGHKIKKINHPVLRDKKCVVFLHYNKYRCKQCGKITSGENPLAFKYFNSSILAIQSTMNLLKDLNYNLKMISSQLNISTTQINTYLDSYVVIPKLTLPESLGIDELYSNSLSKKNSSYICVLVDNVNRGLFDVIDSRRKSALFDYFSSYSKESREKVKYVTIDMWEPYKDIALTFFPNCSIAVDPFHVVEHLIKGLDSLRLSLMNQCPVGSNRYYLLKKWHWLLTKSEVFLDNKKVFNHRFNQYLNRRDILELMLSEFPVLNHAYWLKEVYRDFNKYCAYEEAQKRFDEILDAFKCSKLPYYDDFIGILENWRQEIINSFMRPFDDRKLSNAYTENINGKIGTYLDVSRGIANFSRFRKRILYALNPKIYYCVSNTLSSEKTTGKKRGSYNKVTE